MKQFFNKPDKCIYNVILETSTTIVCSFWLLCFFFLALSSLLNMFIFYFILHVMFLVTTV